jgi:two-component system cell cycle response regulator DivK
VTSPPPGPAESPLVLIVDDNEKNLKLAGDVLRATGFRTLEATSGVEAIAIASQHLPDVILMDLRLPDMAGGEAARKLGDGPRTSRIPVVALTALRLAGDCRSLLADGFAGYLEKPFSVTEFPDEVRRYCSGAQR